MSPADRKAIRAAVAEQCREQGVPLRLEDGPTLERLARLLAPIAAESLPAARRRKRGAA